MSLDGKQLVMPEGETSQEHDLVSPVGRLRITWELYRPKFGNTIAIQTGEIGFTLLRMLRAYPVAMPRTPLETLLSTVSFALCHQHPQPRALTIQPSGLHHVHTTESSYTSSYSPSSPINTCLAFGLVSILHRWARRVLIMLLEQAR